MVSRVLLKLSSGFRHIKEKGIRNTISMVYWYRLDLWYIKLITFFTKNQKLKDFIIIESHNDFDCNGGAFYNYLISNNFNKKYKIVWLLKNPKPNRLPRNVKGFNIYRPSFAKCYYICLAKFFTADDIVTPKVRSDQKEFYLTHGGITFKNVKGILVVPEHVDYILSSSSYYDPYVCENYSIPFPNNKMLHFGYPSNDCFFNNTPNEFAKISSANYYKVFLWMPTFRKSVYFDRNDSYADYPLGIPLINDMNQFSKLNDYLKQTNTFLIIKIHPVQDLSEIRITDLSNIKILTKDAVKELSIDTYNLMKYSDAFISDYSSSAYQYILLNRPIAFVLSDLDKYKLGFSVKNCDDFLPGEHIYDFNDFVTFLEHVVHNKDIFLEKRNELLDHLYEFKDGNACKRLVEFMNL